MYVHIKITVWYHAQEDNPYDIEIKGVAVKSLLNDAIDRYVDLILNDTIDHVTLEMERLEP
jgi:hypothetical protein